MDESCPEGPEYSATELLFAALVTTLVNFVHTLIHYFFPRSMLISELILFQLCDIQNCMKRQREFSKFHGIILDFLPRHGVQLNLTRIVH